MFKIHTKDGLTTRIDLSNPEQLRAWNEKIKEIEFQKTITGISIVQTCGGKLKCNHCANHKTQCSTGIQYSVSKPDGFSKISFIPEHLTPNASSKSKGGAKITCIVDDIELVLMVHAKQPAARITLNKNKESSLGSPSVSTASAIGALI